MPARCTCHTPVRLRSGTVMHLLPPAQGYYGKGYFVVRCDRCSLWRHVSLLVLQ